MSSTFRGNFNPLRLLLLQGRGRWSHHRRVLPRQGGELLQQLRPRAGLLHGRQRAGGGGGQQGRGGGGQNQEGAEVRVVREKQGWKFHQKSSVSVICVIGIVCVPVNLSHFL